MSQQFCLKWNNHMNNMMDVFKNLLSTESMVDVTLACDGLSLKAHKMVLSACSPFFQSLFLENPCKHPIVILKDMKYTELKAIIEFMYHGEVNVAQEQLSALMKTAETLRVKGLAEMPNEKNSSSSAQEEPSHRSVPRTETPPPSKRRRGRVRKRSLSDSNRSDDSNDPKIKQPHSPDIEELSGDVTMDNTSGQFSNLQSQVPMQSLPSHSNPMNSYQKASSVVSQDPQIEEPASADESEFGVEPAKLLEQTLTTDDLQNRRSSRSAMSSGMEMSRRPRSSTDHSSNLVPTSMSSDTSLSANQQPESPPDIKPELLELDPPMSPVAGPSHSADNSMLMYMDQSSVSSHPGTSFQDNTALVPQDSQPQDGYISEVSHGIDIGIKKNPYIMLMKLDMGDFKKNQLISKQVSKESDLFVDQRNEPENEQFSKTNDLVVLSDEGSDVEDEVEHDYWRTSSRKLCASCRYQGIRTRTFWQCKGCDKYFCRTCFDVVHSTPIRGTQNHKGLDSGDVSNVSSSPKKSASGHQSSGKHSKGDRHYLFPSSVRKQCFYCKMRSRSKCQNCNLHFCNAIKTGRKCFELYHLASAAEKAEEKFVDIETKLDEDIENGSDVSHMSDDESVEIISEPVHEQSSQETMHTPLFVKNKKICFYCKDKRSNWRCKICRKSLCVQETGKTCFHTFHSSPKKVKRPDMKRILQAYTRKSH